MAENENDQLLMVAHKCSPQDNLHPSSQMKIDPTLVKQTVYNTSRNVCSSFNISSRRDFLPAISRIPSLSSSFEREVASSNLSNLYIKELLKKESAKVERYVPVNVWRHFFALILNFV